MITLCHHLKDPNCWSFVGEGFEAIVFELNYNSHFPDIAHGACSGLCYQGVLGMVLRVPKLRDIGGPDGEVVLDNLQPYFEFRKHVMNQLIPLHYTTPEVQILVPFPFISRLLVNHHEVRPLKRQKEYDCAITLPWQHQVPERSISCLLLQNFTRNRFLELSSLNRQITQRHLTQLSDAFLPAHTLGDDAPIPTTTKTLLSASATPPQDEVKAQIYSHHPTQVQYALTHSSSTTICYELKPKWGYVRPTRVFDGQSPASLSQASTGAKQISHSSQPQSLLFYTICRTCGLRIQREDHKLSAQPSTSDGEDGSLAPSMQESDDHIFCPLSLYAASSYRYLCYHNASGECSTQPTTHLCQACLDHNRQITSQLDDTIHTLLTVHSTNLRHTVYTTPGFSHSEPCGGQSHRHQHNLSHANILKQLMVSLPMMNLLRILAIYQVILDPDGPSEHVSHHAHPISTATIDSESLLSQPEAGCRLDSPTQPSLLSSSCVQSNLHLHPTLSGDSDKDFSVANVGADYQLWGSIIHQRIQKYFSSLQQAYSGHMPAHQLHAVGWSTVYGSCLVSQSIIEQLHSGPHTHAVQLPLPLTLPSPWHCSSSRHHLRRSRLHQESPIPPQQWILKDSPRGNDGDLSTVTCASTTTHPPQELDASCPHCYDKVCFTSSMTIKDVSVYLSVTPIRLSHLQGSSPSSGVIHGVLLFDDDEFVPILQDNAQTLDIIARQQMPQCDAPQDDPQYSVAILSKSGYFIAPIGDAGVPTPTTSISLRLQCGEDGDEYIPFHTVPHHPSTADAQRTEDHTVTHYLCRIQCADIGPKSLNKYEQYIEQEKAIIQSCLKYIPSACWDGLTPQ